jgi:hypothetical protein
MRWFPRLRYQRRGTSIRHDATDQGTDIVPMAAWPVPAQDRDDMVAFIRVAHRVVLLRQGSRLELCLAAVQVPDPDCMVSRARGENVRL